MRHGSAWFAPDYDIPSSVAYKQYSARINDSLTKHYLIV